MDKREALRILNLIGVTSQAETEFRYLQLRARVEILMTEAKTVELQRMYRETSKSLEEAYRVVSQKKDAKLLTEGNNEQTAEWTEAPEKSDDTAGLSEQIRAVLLELNQMRTSLQQYSKLLELKMQRAETVIRRVETQQKMLDDLADSVTGMRSDIQRNAIALAAQLEEAKRLVGEGQLRRRELFEKPQIEKSTFANVFASKTRH